MAAKSQSKARKSRLAKKKVGRFSLSRAADATYRGEGLRPFFRYRDLGIKHATRGRVGAHVVRDSWDILPRMGMLTVPQLEETLSRGCTACGGTSRPWAP